MQEWGSLRLLAIKGMLITFDLHIYTKSNLVTVTMLILVKKVQ